MAYAINFKESVSKDVEKINKAELGRIFQKIFGELSKDPKRYPELKDKLKGIRKLRIGDYRVLFSITGNEVLILRIGHRKEVYK
ncbi:MAG: type II toxin-antitoxin system mRNA interferase toxin, RelE/StbE family [Nitrosopumilaceae archaeon]|nr:type II toxin-antitoxin system mRNA interferase toxin, RelE/StbE family [Nitrosopumilaceae archaeon]NIX60389.1 type II toxin-antitoxin system mRNA interferase toxin, RelE/StbE family [Nitrosopumilaceae archaeon]